MTDRFLNLLAVNPEAGSSLAESAIHTSNDPVDLAFAHRALAVYRRDLGDVDGTWAHLKNAVTFARETSDPSVYADVMATRGGTHIIFGNPKSGLRDLSRSVDSAEGLLLATVLYRRGVSLSILGRPHAAMRDAEAAIKILQPLNDEVWLPNALSLLGELHCRLGNLAEADRRFNECYAILGDDAGYESIRLRTMRAWLAFLRGDLPTAFGQFSALDLESIDDGRLRGEATWRFATAYLAAGLIPEAIEILASLDGAPLPPTVRATCRGLLAQALLLSGDSERTRAVASAAAAELSRMGLSSESAEAALTGLKAELSDRSARDLAPRISTVARALSEQGSRLAVDGWLLAGEAAVMAGMVEDALADFASGATYRSNSNLLVESSAWLSRARELEIAGGSRVLSACARGFDALDRYRDVMGSSEIRALASHNGRDLSRVALRAALGHPRQLLAWSERWRATALAYRPVTGQAAPSADVAMLRDLGRIIAEARGDGEPIDALERERRRLERRIRSQHHQLRTEGGRAETFDAAELVAELRDQIFLQIVEVDGVLHVLVVNGGRVRHVVAGPAATAEAMADSGRFALRRAAKTGRFNPGDLGGRLQEAILGPAARLLRDVPIIVSPTASLHGVPFGLMPALSGHPFSVVPSAAQWLRARKVPEPPPRSPALVAGPNLVTGGSEVARLAKRYPDATVLTNQAATVEATMSAIDGAHLAHLATHGTFRADSPLFSALEMADGPLSVYELERLKRAPYRTILSACDSGVLAPVGAQEVLGLASALFSLGSAGLVCSIAEVNDEVTADLMMDVHAELDAGRTPAEALAKVRAEADPIKLATASAFVALGV